DQVAEFGQALTEAGVEHDIVVYPGAPHGFFDEAHDDQAAACDDAWARVLAFLAARA
ncbi:MAG: dienelactone hydrolase family protein, partial [Nonomuraea sp.]|nr:dienelactone hydrolase family protein [Nonomuraea sp.]